MTRKKRNQKRKLHQEENTPEKTEFLESVQSVEPDETDLDNTLHEETMENNIEPTESHQANEQNLNQDNPELVEKDVIHHEYISIGDRLRQKREEQGISLKNISQHTKIALTKLEYLEEDKLDLLPNKAYVIGYVKSYSKLVGLNANESILHLRETYNVLNPPKIIEEVPEQTPISNISNDLITKAAVGVVGIVLFVGAIIFFSQSYEDKAASLEENQGQQERGSENNPQNFTTKALNSETPLKKVSTEANSENKQANLPEKKEHDITAKKKEEVKEQIIKEEAMALKKKNIEEKLAKEKRAEEKLKKEKLAKEKEENKEVPRPKFYAMSMPLYSFDTKIDEAKAKELIPEIFRNSVIADKQNVIISATKDASWLTYKSDDRKIKKFILKKGKNVLLRGNEIRIFIGNVGAVKVFLNNRPLNIKSRSGVKSLVFPQENRSKYYLPLFIYKKDGTVLTSDEYITLNNIEEPLPNN
jgi:cytoskeleton protein RodZ